MDSVQNYQSSDSSEYFKNIWTIDEALPSVHHPSSLSLPGITEESRKVVARMTLTDYYSHNCFFNPQGFHNHLMHHIFAALSIGAQPDRLEEIYAEEAKIQKPIGPFKPVEITESNWSQFIGERDYYPNYLAFFSKELRSKEVGTVLANYLFDSAESKTFFASFMSGVYHPLIHIGYGLEFSSIPMIAEGLALTACTKPIVANLLLDPPSTDILSTPINAAKIALEAVTSTLGLTSQSTAHPTSHHSALSIVDKVYNDSTITGVIKFEDDPKFNALLNNSNLVEKIKEYARNWTVSNSKEDIQAKTKELIGFAMAVYSGTTRPGKEIKLDFFLMHSLTSALFLPIFAHHFTSNQTVQLLQAHFIVTLAYYVSRGSPRIHLTDNVNSYQSEVYTEDKKNNPWLKVIENTIAHEDVHLVKVIRSLLYGDSYLAHDSKSEDKKEISSNFWLNSAKITLDGIGGDKWWIQDGIGFDQVWDGRPDRGPNSIVSEDHAH